MAASTSSCVCEATQSPITCISRTRYVSAPLLNTMKPNDAHHAKPGGFIALQAAAATPTLCLETMCQQQIAGYTHLPTAL